MNREKMNRVKPNRVKIRGKVVGKASVVIGRSIGCKVRVEVLNDIGSYDLYDIIVTKGRRPWKLKPGDAVTAIGILKDDTLWADFWLKLK